MNLVVTGTRRGSPLTWPVLNAYRKLWGPPYLILGGDLNGSRYSQSGVDLQAFEWGRANHCHGMIEYAFWDRFGDGAGPERNGRMVRRAGEGHHLLAIPDERSRGTWNCYRQGLANALLAVVVRADTLWIDELERLHRRRWL